MKEILQVQKDFWSLTPLVPDGAGTNQSEIRQRLQAPHMRKRQSL